MNNLVETLTNQYFDSMLYEQDLNVWVQKILEKGSKESSIKELKSFLTQTFKNRTKHSNIQYKKYKYFNDKKRKEIVKLRNQRDSEIKICVLMIHLIQKIEKY